MGKEEINEEAASREALVASSRVGRGDVPILTFSSEIVLGR